MRKYLIILSVFMGILHIAQAQNLDDPHILQGTVLDFNGDRPVVSCDVMLFQETDSIPILVSIEQSDSLGHFIFDSLPPATYRILVDWGPYETVLIQNIKLEYSKDLCKVYLFEMGIEWDGVEYDLNNKPYPIGGYDPGYLEKNAVDGNLELKYFCNRTIKCTYSNFTLIIDFSQLE